MSIAWWWFLRLFRPEGFRAATAQVEVGVDRDLSFAGRIPVRLVVTVW
jgi:hypothetical protein